LRFIVFGDDPLKNPREHRDRKRASKPPHHRMVFAVGSNVQVHRPASTPKRQRAADTGNQGFDALRTDGQMLPLLTSRDTIQRRDESTARSRAMKAPRECGRRMKRTLYRTLNFGQPDDHLAPRADVYQPVGGLPVKTAN
jgi:hypothetical protein